MAIAVFEDFVGALGTLSRFICHFRLSHYQITTALSTVRTVIIGSLQHYGLCCNTARSERVMAYEDKDAGL